MCLLTKNNVKERYNFLIALICDDNQTCIDSKTLYKILEVGILVFYKNGDSWNHVVEYVPISNINYSNNQIIGLEYSFYEKLYNPMYVSFDDSVTPGFTEIYINNDGIVKHEEHFVVPKILKKNKGKDIGESVKLYFRYAFKKGIEKNYALTLKYDFTSDTVTPIFDRDDMIEGTDEGDLDNCQYWVVCDGIKSPQSDLLLSFTNTNISREEMQNGVIMYGVIVLIDSSNCSETIIINGIFTRDYIVKHIFIYKDSDVTTLKNMVITPDVINIFESCDFSFEIDSIKLYVPRNTKAKIHLNDEIYRNKYPEGVDLNDPKGEFTNNLFFLEYL